MDRTTRLKEAFKTGLAFALVFGIALWFDWMNPYWAGWAVAVIALPSAGASIRKGLLRITGTIPGCCAALAIHAVAAQDRWLFLALTCAWMFGTTYLMVRQPKDSYFWTMAAYVCLVILLSDLDDSANMFESAVFRTVETAMGVMVYTVIAVFLWPRSSRGAIQRASIAAVTSLATICRSGREAMLGQEPPPGISLSGLQATAAAQLLQCRQALEAEGPEHYAVREAGHQWDRLRTLSGGILEAAGRWQSGLPEMVGIDVRAVFPDFDGFCARLELRLSQVPRRLAGESAEPPPPPAGLVVDEARLRQLPAFEQAAVAVARRELEQIEQLSQDLLACAQALADGVSSGPEPKPPVPPMATWLPVPDLDHLRSAAFVATTTGVGFLVWILFDPPGHSGWFQMTGTIALLVAMSPTLRVSRLILPVAITSLICLAIYVFVMPQLSTFLGLGSLLFLCMFANCYLMTGMARFFCSMAMLNVLQIQNHQVYAFAPMANLVLFLVLAFTFLHIMTYLLGSPRPEKAVPRLLRDFFRSAGYLVAHGGSGAAPRSWTERWMISFHRRRLRSLPAQVAAWAGAIDRGCFPGNRPEQVQALAASLQGLVRRLEQLMEAARSGGPVSIAHHLDDELRAWNSSLEALFLRWSQDPGGESANALREQLAAGMIRLGGRIEEAVGRAAHPSQGDESERFYPLLGSFRGVSEAALAFAGAAGAISWSHWQEERFS